MLSNDFAGLLHTVALRNRLAAPFDLIPSYVSAYWANPSKKDSVERRIRNAIHLLVEADRQEQHAIGLALSVGAMEALVGRKGEELAGLIADSVATMLEPEPQHRADAVEFAKKIYDARSQVLHGSTIEAESDRRDQARLLAAALLKAMVKRRNTLVRAGYDSETPDDLLKEIKRGKFSEGLPAGVTECSVTRLWRPKKEQLGLAPESPS
jgi:hypothetical protein